MADIKYPEAFYRDREFGQLVSLRAENLVYPATLERARLEELFDETEQVRLTPRVGDVRAPHFAGKPVVGRRLIKGEKNVLHDERVEDFVKKLSGQKNWVFGMIGPKKPNNEPPDFREETTLFDYRWGNEIHQIMDEQTIVRHDVFGASNELSMSVRQPSIAIEVINTHYPEEAAFSAFLEKSKREPYIVLFDIILVKDKKYINTFVKADAVLRRLTYRAYTFLIRDGNVYRGNARTGITTSARLRIDVENMIDGWGSQRGGKV